MMMLISSYFTSSGCVAIYILHTLIHTLRGKERDTPTKEREIHRDDKKKMESNGYSNMT